MMVLSLIGLIPGDDNAVNGGGFKKDRLPPILSLL